MCLGTNKTFLGFVTVLLNFIFPYKSYFCVVSGSHMRSDVCYLILAEENETYYWRLMGSTGSLGIREGPAKRPEDLVSLSSTQALESLY